MKQNITAQGHSNVLSTHQTTIEITKHTDLTESGDCIIGVRANAACADLNQELKTAIQACNKIKITLTIGDISDTVTGYGSPDLTLTHENDIVLRTSDFKCSRTLMINADKAAADLKPELIEKLKNPATKLNFTIEVLDE